MIPMTSNEVHKVTPAARAIGRLPNQSDVKKAPMIPQSPIILVRSIADLALAIQFSGLTIRSYCPGRGLPYLQVGRNKTYSR